MDFHVTPSESMMASEALSGTFSTSRRAKLYLNSHALELIDPEAGANGATDREERIG